MNKKYESVIYKITYPKGKIYIGSDRTNDINYFGSAYSELIAADYNEEERKIFTITREILWGPEQITLSELLEKENEYIKRNEANNPQKGYNLRPKLINNKEKIDLNE